MRSFMLVAVLSHTTAPWSVRGAVPEFWFSERGTDATRTAVGATPRSPNKMLVKKIP